MRDKTESYWQRRAYQAEETLRSVDLHLVVPVEREASDCLVELQGLILLGASLAEVDARIEEMIRCKS
jgi:hypothetical protein